VESLQENVAQTDADGSAEMRDSTRLCRCNGAAEENYETECDGDCTQRCIRKARDGRVYRPSWRDKKTGEMRESPTWWVSFSRRGKLIRESSHSTKESDARKLLRKRLGEIALGKPVGPDIERTIFEDLAGMVVLDYRANARRSLARVDDALAHLREYFGDYRAVEITGDNVTSYITNRQQQKAG
jgi:hypothetical protein